MAPLPDDLATALRAPVRNWGLARHDSAKDIGAGRSVIAQSAGLRVR